MISRLSILICQMMVPMTFGRVPDGPRPTTIPAKFAEVQAGAEQWVKSLLDRSEPQIYDQLGKNCKHSTWQFEGKDCLQLDYDLEHHCGIEVFFGPDQHVVYAVLKVTSD